MILPWREKIALIIGSVCLSIIFLELGLRASGAIVLFLHGQGDKNFILSRSKTAPFMARMGLTAQVFRLWEPRALARVGSIEQKRAIKIICLGDSHTWGFGSSSGKSYPSRLEVLLNESKLQKNFRVLNLGLPGMNTVLIAEELKKKFYL